MTASSAQLRRDAVRRIAEIAGYDDRLDVGLVLSRPQALQVLLRQALKRAVGDQLLLEEIGMLFPIGRGQGAALDDAIHQADGALPERTPEAHGGAGEAMSLDELARVLQEVID